ncbi:ferritin-like fold-containing protein [Zhihengliuella sp.]|uniref:ferritin-like fold-containing protein n=1 Tax=Zhihengliuella sp. TaxID=1954483 RepID=UPI0028126E8F|nr:ferritin-like fold-containing protein [Zhihengliuella sp.]
MMDSPLDRSLEPFLYGLMAYRELTAFERLSSDARFSPTLADRMDLARLAVTEYEHFELVRAALLEAGLEPDAAMAPYVDGIDRLHERTRPGDWYESLMKAYVMDALTSDLYAALGTGPDQRALLTERARALVGRIQRMDDQTAWLAGRLQRAMDEDARLAPRLALWGRRVVGESLTQARRLLERDDVGPLFGGADAKAALLANLTQRHSRRMSALGLTS